MARFSQNQKENDEEVSQRNKNEKGKKSVKRMIR
jgi:hypothetical protein